MANENGDFPLQRVRIVGGLTQVFDALEVAFQDFWGIVKHDQAISRIAPRSPQKIGLVAAERRWKSVAAAEEVNGAGLAVILSENAAPCAFLWRELGVSLIDFGDNLFPSELISKVLREDRAHVTVLTAGHLERKLLHIENELLHGENRHNHWGKPRPSRKNHYDKRRL